jgi:hypothetical protein
MMAASLGASKRLAPRVCLLSAFRPETQRTGASSRKNLLLVLVISAFDQKAKSNKPLDTQTLRHTRALVFAVLWVLMAMFIVCS